MSNIVNYKTGRTVNRQDYVDDGFGDVYERSLIETGVLPCIYSGFEVTAGSGLTVVVSPGYARGLDIPFTINGATASPLPTIVNDITTVSTINIPANSQGYIVLNVNIWDAETGTTGYTSNGNLYKISATTNANIPSGSNVGAIFVTSLQNGTNTSWPFTQIVLAQVISGSSSITSINTNYNISSPQRSFDFTNQLTAFNNGLIDLNNFNLTGNGVVNIPDFLNTSTLNPTMVSTVGWRFGQFNQATAGSNIITLTLPTPYTTTISWILVGGQAIATGSNNFQEYLPIVATSVPSAKQMSFNIECAPTSQASAINFIGTYLTLGF